MHGHARPTAAREDLLATVVAEARPQHAVPAQERADRLLQPARVHAATVELGVEVRADPTQDLALVAPDPVRLLHRGQLERRGVVHVDPIPGRRLGRHAFGRQRPPGPQARLLDQLRELQRYAVGSPPGRQAHDRDRVDAAADQVVIIVDRGRIGADGVRDGLSHGR